MKQSDIEQRNATILQQRSQQVIIAKARKLNKKWDSAKNKLSMINDDEVYLMNHIGNIVEMQTDNRAQFLDCYRNYVKKCPRRNFSYAVLEYIISLAQITNQPDLIEYQKKLIDLYLEELRRKRRSKRQDHHLYQLVELLPSVKEYIESKGDYHLIIDEIDPQLCDFNYGNKSHDSKIREQIEKKILGRSVTDSSTLPSLNQIERGIHIDEYSNLLDQAAANGMLKELFGSYDKNILTLKYGLTDGICHSDEEIMGISKITKGEIDLAIDLAIHHLHAYGYYGDEHMAETYALLMEAAKDGILSEILYRHNRAILSLKCGLADGICRSDEEIMALLDTKKIEICYSMKGAKSRLHDLGYYGNDYPAKTFQKRKKS